MAPRFAFRLIAVATLVAACSDGLGPVSGPPALMVVVAGDSQSGAVGFPLNRALRVKVVDAAGAPVWLTTVRFVPAGGSGSVAPVVGTTDERGEVETQWTLGRLVGPHRLSAIALDGPPEAAFLFNATGLPGPATRLLHVVGFAQTGFPNQTLATPLLARVSDAFGNGVPGVSVRYRMVRGTGQLSASQAVSDSTGLAAVSWTLGPDVTGVPDSVLAEVDGLQGSPLYYTALVLPP